MGKSFRWGIIGASTIARKFCDAVRRMKDCTVAAIGSRDISRAEGFAREQKIEKAYGSYAEMLEKAELDGVYIAVPTGNHYSACMLCIEYGLPFLCEKTMCMNSVQTREVFDAARKKGLFCMEAMWSRFLPMVHKMKEWCSNGSIGALKFIECPLGFCAEKNDANRFWNPELGGGAAYDLLVYGYEITRFLTEKKPKDHYLSVVKSKTGVDSSDVLVLQYDGMHAVLTASLETSLSCSLIISGEDGRIITPNILFSNEAFLYDRSNAPVERFVDDKTENGFIYEIREAMDCIRKKKLQSEVVPHELTLEFAEICDEIPLK